MCLDCFDQGCPPDIKDMGQNSGQWRGGLISMSRCDDCPCPHCSHSTLSSWAHLVMTDSRGRALLASKLVNVSNPYISEACLVSGSHLFEVMCFLGVSPLCGVSLAPLGPEKSHGMGPGPQKLRRVVLGWAIWALLSFVGSRRRLHRKLHLCSRCNSVMMQERTNFIFVRLLFEMIEKKAWSTEVFPIWCLKMN